MGSGFTYQGRLRLGGNPVTTNGDFIFSLWDASAGGNQIGSDNTVTNQLNRTTT